MKTFQSLSIIAIAAFAGCGGDPLVGTWGNAIVTQPNASSSKLTLAFKSGNKITATGVDVFSNSSPSLPGCTRTAIENGTYKETTASSTVAITYTSGTVMATGCLDAPDEHDTPVALGADALSVLNQSYTYSVSGSTLTLSTPEGALAYTKQ